jgi:tRNA-dihydrouridine synthase A
MSRIGTATSQSLQAIDRKVAVAPMMDWTDRHCRYFLRGFSSRTLLYTEMITAEALLRGDAAHLLRHAPEEHPLALQLGGSSPERLAAAARIGEQAGYLEINLNCGCPSERVHAGAFGACLMGVPSLVADCIAAMRAAVAVPVTVKMRIGVIDSGAGRPIRERLAIYDEQDYEHLLKFTAAVSAAGCEAFIVHARQAVLGSLSPKENREVPPLRPQVVRRLAAEYPALRFVLNGGLRTVAQVVEALDWCDGVMLGREAYHRPYLLWELHQQIFTDGWPRPAEGEMLERMVAYAEREVAAGTPLASITRHMFGLHAGQPGARSYRQHLSEGVRRPGAGVAVLRSAGQVAADRAQASAGA